MKSNWLKLKFPIVILALTSLLFSAHFVNVYVFRKIQKDQVQSKEETVYEKHENLIEDIAKEIITYSLDLQQGVEHLRKIQNCADHELSFERIIQTTKTGSRELYNTIAAINPEAPEKRKCHLFDNTNGAFKKFKNNFEDISLQQPVTFSAEFQILDQNKPKFKKNQSQNNDLAMYMHVSKNLCKEINNQLGMKIEGFVLEKDLPSEEFKGTYNKINSIKSAPDDGETIEGATDLFREKADQMGCWKHSTSETYIFYLTLVLRNN